ncbi:hypothetical protein HDU67_001413 [Dinochytrium kinnereticum]|nr:hypothetical protein HDU67_001413 [Dinochytrium kinnereticum]
MLQNAMIFNQSFLPVTNYDRLWPHFLRQIQRFEAVTLVYYVDTRFRDYVASTVKNQDLIILLRSIRDPHGLRLYTLIRAPQGDFTGEIDATATTLREKLNRNMRFMMIIGSALTLAKHMEEVAKFDFASLHGKDKNDRSLIRELGVMQTSFWKMISAFAKGIQDNRRLVTGNTIRSQTSAASTQMANQTSQNMN